MARPRKRRQEADAAPAQDAVTAPQRAAGRDGAVRGCFESLQAGRFAEARELVRPFVQPDDLEARLLFGLALGGSGEALAAAPVLNAIAIERPGALHPSLDLLALLQKHRRVRDAEAVFRTCLRLTPRDPRLLAGFGQFLHDRYRLEEAEAAVAESLRIAPGSFVAQNQHAIILVALGRTEEGLALFRRIVAEDPGNASAWANLGCTLTAEGAFEEALAAYRESIRLSPAEPQVRLNHSITLLKAGRMVQGWSEHEWRLRLPGHTQFPSERMLPNLATGLDLSGRTVMVTHEEGLGDTLMFLRYVPLLAQAGATVVLWVPGPLARLAARVDGVAGVRATDTAALEADWHCPFISLPRVFTGTAMPWGVAPPYLAADPERVAAAASQLPRDGRLRVGLVWGGAPRPDDPPAHAVDRRRSVPLAALAPLGAVQNVVLVSLQLGPHADALRDPPEGLALLDPTGFIEDMDDTASLLLNLDVLVSVDTSVVHLAGGLGVPVILMDRFDNCWRWFHGREDSPWYPDLRIVRQTRMGAWDGVVSRVAAMLQQMADAKQAGLG